MHDARRSARQVFADRCAHRMRGLAVEGHGGRNGGAPPSSGTSATAPSAGRATPEIDVPSSISLAVLERLRESAPEWFDGSTMIDGGAAESGSTDRSEIGSSAAA